MTKPNSSLPFPPAELGQTATLLDLLSTSDGLLRQLVGEISMTVSLNLPDDQKWSRVHAFMEKIFADRYFRHTECLDTHREFTTKGFLTTDKCECDCNG